MPWIRQIKGDMKLTAKALSMILGKPVDVESRIITDQTPEAACFMLGHDAALSVDTVCGTHFAEPYLQWVFTINDLAPNDTEQYRPQQPFGKLLRRFEELFIPLDAEAIFEYHCEEHVTVEAGEPILGYGFYL
jgi:hypothetical protein